MAGPSATAYMKSAGRAACRSGCSPLRLERVALAVGERRVDRRLRGAERGGALGAGRRGDVLIKLREVGDRVDESRRAQPSVALG